MEYRPSVNSLFRKNEIKELQTGGIILVPVIALLLLFLSFLGYAKIQIDQGVDTMPLYEYWCRHCKRKVMLYLSTFSKTSPSCPQCGNDTLHRLFSTFSVRSKTYKDTYEDILSDSQLTHGMLANDPRALAEWNRRMSQSEEVAPEYEEMIERMEKGEMPAELAGTATSGPSEEADQV
jgi:putative FmdB family regulatory protein